MVAIYPPLCGEWTPVAAELHHWERILSVFQGIFQLLQSMILEENFMESEYRGIGDGLNKKSTSAI